jgi:mycothiol synthase
VEEIRYLMNMSLCHPEGVLFIAEGERLVGYCWTIDDPSDKAKGFIRMMGVDPPYHGRGLGRAMLVAGLDYLQRRGIDIVELTVDSRNNVAKSLYQSLGFKKKSTTIWYEKRLSPR